MGHFSRQITEHRLRVETHRSGVFVFQVGVDAPSLLPELVRVEDAHLRFSSMPVIPDVAVQLEKEVVVASVFGTNTIEGGTLTEAETAAVIESKSGAHDEKEQRVINIKRAYDKADEFAAFALSSYKNDTTQNGFAVLLEETMLTDLHAIITAHLHHPLNRPGQYRDNQKGQTTKVGDAEHGGVYTPPKCFDDIQMLVRHFLTWINSPELLQLPPLIRAPLAHYYFERIHPFWDGNGRVGRVIEMLILKCAGFKYAHFALSRFYLDHIDEYFTVFNTARKSEERGEAYPNTAFVEFFARGMLTVINQLHDRANQIISLVLFQNRLDASLRNKNINLRQYSIVRAVLEQGMAISVFDLQSKPWFQALYLKLSDKTRLRDIKGLEEAGFVRIENKLMRLVVP